MEGKYWIGSQEMGIFRYDPTTKELQNFRNQKNDSTSISSNIIYSIIEDTHNRLWITTDGGGLNYLNKKTFKFKAFRDSDGLPSNVLYGILVDTSGRLWVSTNNGLSCITVKGETDNPEIAL